MIRSSNALGVLTVIFPFPLTAYQGVLNSKSRHLSPRSEIRLNDSPARDILNARRTEKLTGRDDRVECVRVEPMLGDKRGFGGCGEGGRGRSEGWTGAGESEWVE